MKRSLVLLALILLFEMGTINGNAQSLIVKTKAGVENVKQLSVLKKLTFSNSNLLVYSTGAATDTYSLSTVSKLYFKTVATNAESLSLDASGQCVSVYPNPAKNLIYIQSVPDGTSTVSIYRIDGVHVMNVPVVPGGNSVDVSSLNCGMYLLRVNNQTVKFIKL